MQLRIKKEIITLDPLTHFCWNQNKKKIDKEDLLHEFMTIATWNNCFDVFWAI